MLLQASPIAQNSGLSDETDGSNTSSGAAAKAAHLSIDTTIQGNASQIESTAATSARGATFTHYPMTIRLRLTLWYTALLGATLILFSVLVYWALAANLAAQYLQDAATQAYTVSQAISRQLERDIAFYRKPLPPDLDNLTRSFGVQIIDLSGENLARSRNLGLLEIPSPPEVLGAIERGNAYRFYYPAEDVQLLVYSVPLKVGDKTVAIVQLIKPPADGAQNALNQVSRYLILGTAFSLLIAAVIGAWLARRTLAPIDEITHTASNITRAKDLGQRLHIPDDASEVGQLAATFNEMLDRIQKLFTAQERLVADVSHELRTPLTTVQGNIDLLQRVLRSNGANPSLTHEVSAILPEILNEVEDETKRMNNMIRDLLLLAQADSGVLQLKMEAVELDTLLLDVYRQSRKVAERTKGAGALEIRIGHEDQALVWGDPERLRQVLVNFTDNAIKYTPSGGTITLSLENQTNWVKVTVADTGIGIKAEDREMIFERFYRTDKARSREMGGSGLGLSIARWIAQAHNGKITVESTVGVGSTFTLWLPEYVEATTATPDLQPVADQ